MLELAMSYASSEFGCLLEFCLSRVFVPCGVGHLGEICIAAILCLWAGLGMVGFISLCCWAGFLLAW